MTKFYKKNELWFALIWIIVYVVGASITDMLSESVGVTKLLTVVLLAVLSAVLIIWMKKNALLSEYGLCKSEIKAKKFLFYIPLIVLASCNLWLGVSMSMSIAATIFYVLSMLLAGFVEETIFRGLLFKAMCRRNVKTAIIITSLTFGIGHIVNLVNGSGAELLPNLCQVCYAVAFGFMFVILFYKGRSLLPCILTHSILNASSAFVPVEKATDTATIAISLITIFIAVAYSVYLCKKLPDPTE